jgi:Dockerin type I domain
MGLSDSRPKPFQGAFMQQILLTMRVVTVTTFSLLIVLISVSGSRAAHRIKLEVQDTSVVVGQSFDLKIYLDNPVDSVAAYTFWIGMSRPDIAKFDMSGIGCDTSGTLTSGAEYIAVNDPGSGGTILRFTCLMDYIDVPGSHPPISPQSGGVLVKLRINTFLTPFPLDDTLDFLINPSLQVTGFSDPHGNVIGLIHDTIIDTTFFRCLQRIGSDCLAWEQCPAYQCNDSLFIDTVPHPFLDTTQVALIDGRAFISLPTCDNNGNISVNVVDLLCVVNYLFGGFNPVTCPTFHCDANKSGGVNVVDLTYLVQYLFQGGPPPR